MKNKLVLTLLSIITSCHLFAIEAVVFYGEGKSREEKFIAMTIAGIVNRNEPKLYLMDVYETWSYTQTDESWFAEYEKTGHVTFKKLYDTNELVQHFKSYLNGAITYDPALTYGNFSGQSFLWQGEVACMLGGLTDCIPLPYNNTTIQINKLTTVSVPDHFNGQVPINVSAQLELASHPWNNKSLTPEQRYFHLLDWGLDNLLTRTNPSKFYIREITDWAVNQRMFQLNLAGTEDLKFTSLSDEKAAKIERVMNYLKEKHPNEIFHVYGWMRPEPLVQWISAWGGSFHETLLSNLSWHHVFPVDNNFEYKRLSDEDFSSLNIENKHYVVILASEGDAGNWVVGFQGGAWNSKTRGEVPMGWAWNLQMFEEFPFIAQYYYRTATPKDGFLAMSTPLGYAYPDVFPSDFLPDAISKTKQLKDKFSVHSTYGYKHYNGAGKSKYRNIEISNNFDFSKLGNFANETHTNLTFIFDPALQTQRAYTNYGELLFNHVDDNTFYADVRNLQTVADRLVSKLQYKQKPSFLLGAYQRFRQDGTFVDASNPSDMTLPRLKEVITKVKASSIGNNVEFVTPEKFTYLLRKSLGLSNAMESEVQNVQEFYAALDNGQIKLHAALNRPHNLIVNIHDIAGRVIHSEKWEMSSGQEDKILNLDSPLNNGIYLININSPSVNLTTKLVK